MSVVLGWQCFQGASHYAGGIHTFTGKGYKKGFLSGPPEQLLSRQIAMLQNTNVLNNYMCVHE